MPPFTSLIHFFCDLDRLFCAWRESTEKKTLVRVMLEQFLAGSQFVKSFFWNLRNHDINVTADPQCTTRRFQSEGFHGARMCRRGKQVRIMSLWLFLAKNKDPNAGCIFDPFLVTRYATCYWLIEFFKPNSLSFLNFLTFSERPCTIGM